MQSELIRPSGDQRVSQEFVDRVKRSFSVVADSHDGDNEGKNKHNNPFAKVPHIVHEYGKSDNSNLSLKLVPLDSCFSSKSQAEE